MRVLLDNDVVLDFLLRREPFYNESKELFIRAAKREITIFIAAITPINCFYIIRKERDIETAHESVKKLLKIVKICAVNKATLENATQLDFADYEDAVQCASAEKTKLEYLVTRNLKDFKKSTIAVTSPNDLLHLLDSPGSITLRP